MGKRVWPDFHPYTMGRYFATEMMIATDFNVYKVAEAIGDEVRTVEKHYLDRARARSQMNLEYVPRTKGVRADDPRFDDLSRSVPPEIDYAPDGI